MRTIEELRALQEEYSGCQNDTSSLIEELIELHGHYKNLITAVNNGMALSQALERCDKAEAEVKIQKEMVELCIEECNRSRQIVSKMSELLRPESGESNVDVAKRRMEELVLCREAISAVKGAFLTPIARRQMNSFWGDYHEDAAKRCFEVLPGY